MIGVEDALFTFEYDDYYKILPMLNNFHIDKERIGNGEKVSDDFSYSSDTNKMWMSISELQQWLGSFEPH